MALTESQIHTENLRCVVQLGMRSIAALFEANKRLLRRARALFEYMLETTKGHSEIPISPNLPPQAKASRNQAVRRCEGFWFLQEKKRPKEKKTRGGIRRPPFARHSLATPELLALFTSAPFTLLNPPFFIRELPVTWFSLIEIYTNALCSRSFAMADSSESRPVARATKPVSEALLNEKVWTYPGGVYYISTSIVAFDPLILWGNCC